MKNHSTILSFSLFGAIAIFITIAVCLAGFSGAEMPPGYHTNNHHQGVGKEMAEENSLAEEKLANSQQQQQQQTSKSRGDDDELSEQTNFANYFRNLQGEGNYGKQMKRRSENLRKGSAESEAEDSDGYEYDDDEFYHFDIKREGDQGSHSDESLQSERKDAAANGKNFKAKNDKEDETIEMLNFSQTRTKTGASDASQSSLKNFPDKGSQPYGQSASLKMSDLKENSGISDKEKGTKEESDTSSNGDQKLVQAKKDDASPQEKDSSKLKDSKVDAESEKKENEAAVKGNVDSLTAKNVKDSAKTSESKVKDENDAKIAKLKGEANSGDNSENKSSLKDGERDTGKLVKDEKDNPKLVNKLNSEDAGKSEISQNDNKANLASSDFKESGKLSGIEEEDKDDEEMGDKNMAVRYYQGNTNQRKETDEMAKSFELVSDRQRNMDGVSRSKAKEIFTFPVAFEIKSENLKDMYKNQDQQVKAQESVQRLEQPVKSAFHLNFPPSDLENTEYHKNFIKSLRRYKGLDDSGKPAKEGYTSQRGSYFYPPLIARGTQPLNKKAKIRKRKSKIESGAGSQSRDPVEGKKSSRSVQVKSAGQGADKKSVIGKKNVKKEDKYRRRRKSPQKFEYKIKIINEPSSKNSGSSRKRKKKDAKAKMFEGKLLKKNPVSRVSLGDLTKLNYLKSGRSLKRRDSTWFGEGEFKTNEDGEQGVLRIRGLPSGSYNRVKYGNKQFLRDEDGQIAPRSFRNAGWLYENSSPSKGTRSSSFQCSYGTGTSTLQGMKHDPEKRFAGNNIFNSAGRGNSLLLIKKGRNGERITKTFTDETKDDPQKSPESEELARILSQDSDYIVLKKTDNNKYQKISVDNLKDGPASSREFRSAAAAAARSNKRSFTSPIGVQEKTSSGRKALIRLHRSSDQKNHNPNTISTSLKKTFEKFKDLADFFKDSEQEAQDTQQQTPELKEASDIVFSEDKLPDPLVINNEVDEKNPKLKSQNSMTSISTNFKQLDQDKKDGCKDLFMDLKGDNSVSQLKPAIKNAFPEAKSVSSVMKDGKEIILIDLNKNELMMNHKSHNVLGSSCGSSDRSSKPLIIPGNRQVEIIWNPNPTYLDQAGAKNVLDKKYPVDRGFDRVNRYPDQEARAALSGQPLVTMPLNDLAQLSILLKQLNDKKEAVAETHGKILTKKSVTFPPNLKTSSNIAQFLQDYRKLSEINNEQLSKKIGVAQKRDPNSFAGAFPVLPSSYSDNNEKDVRDFLENPGGKESQKPNEFGGVENEGSRQGFTGWENEEKKPAAGFSNPEKLESNFFSKRQGQWSSAKDNRDYVPFKSSWNEYNPKDLKSNLGNILRIEEEQDNINGKDYQEELLEELSEASNKIERLRREGADDQSLRKTMESALPFKAAHKSENQENEKVTSDSKLNNQGVENCDSNSNEKDSKAKDSDETQNGGGDAELTADAKKDKDLEEESQVKDNKLEPLQKRDEKSQLRKSIESINIDNLSELVGGERDGAQNERNPSRRKRSSEVKVSTTEVENTILSNFTEDNYQSVYSPGIKRKLLSVDDDDADRYYNEDRNGENVSESTCVKNVVPDCSDPALSNCFHERDAEHYTNRPKRSLTDNFHSNHKREIDQDESMPNDFQNFLETSLGLDSHVPGIGGQKREAFKEEEQTAKENKEPVQGENDPVDAVPSGGNRGGDSPLEKREVSEVDDTKRKSFKDRSFTDFDRKMGKVRLQNLKASSSIGRIHDRPEIKLGAAESESGEKFPTQIRIQITKDTAKDSKGERPILDESDITSNEMENSFKEKEFFEKSKFHSSSSGSGEKLYSTSKFKNLYAADYGNDEADTDFGAQRYYMVSNPLKKKKKRKFMPENGLIPVQDLPLNQKLSEGLIRKFVSDRNLYEATTQRVPVSNHLPQVETVYNPTQGANKAQVMGCGLTLKENTNANSKNNLQPHQDSIFDEKVFKLYVNDKHDSEVKSVKDEPKDVESLNWKPYARKMKLRQDSDQSPAQNPNYRNLGLDSGIKSRSMARKSINQLKQLQKPYGSYLSSYPSGISAMSSDSAYDPSKQKPDFLWNALSKETSNSKLLKDATSNYDFSNAKDTATNIGSKLDDASSWKEYNGYYSNKNPNSYKFRNYISSSVVNALSDKSLNSQSYLKSLQDTSASGADSPNGHDNSKDSEYQDSIEDQYGDSDEVKQEPQFLMEDHSRRDNKLFAPEKYQKIVGYKVADEENASPNNSGGQEADEDYEGNNEDDFEDYSLSPSPNLLEKAKQSQEDEKVMNSYRGSEPLYSSLHQKTNKFQQGRNSLTQGEFKNGKKDDKLNANSQQSPFSESVKEPIPYNSLNVLKMANENSNVLGKNLMKNLQKYNYDSSLRIEEKLPNERSFVMGSKYPNLKGKEKLNLRNINSPVKRSHPVGNRFIYAAKTETFDLKDFEPKKAFAASKENVRCSHYQLPKSNPLSAQLSGMENEFEYESEDNNKYFGENLLSGGKGGFMKEGNQLKSGNKGGYDNSEEYDHEKIKRNSLENVETVKGNLVRDDDENISEDGVLENVIGKYIMRKSVKINPDKKVKNNGFEPVGTDKKKFESSPSDEINKHKFEKRSVGNGHYLILKINREKRFSGGHLTENNYRKFHKKNSRRRRVTEKVGGGGGGGNFGQRKIPLDRSRRCGRGVFRKLSKEKDSKKIDVPDVKTAGFEPILWDSRAENARNVKQETGSKPEKVYTLYTDNRHAMDKKVRIDSGVGFGDRGIFREGGKSSASQSQGPWKIRLNEKNLKVSEQSSKQGKTRFGQNQLLDNQPGEALTPNGLRAYLLLRNNVGPGESEKMSQEDSISPTSSGAFVKEVGSSYRHFHEGGEETPGKRSGRSSAANASPTAANRESSVISLEETIRKDLESRQSLVGGDSKARAPLGDRKKADFVNGQGQRLRFVDKNNILSNGRLRKSVVLPISTDANIFGDSRHINEETSKNLGQQIVEAILTHVSTNPRFKQVIAPGLSGKSPTSRQTLKSGKSAAPKIKYPDQVQSFLQTIMRHIEKMAENDVKKRMCNKIDRQSKDFLRSMLEFPEITVPRSCKQKKGFFVDPPCPEMCPKPCSVPRVPPVDMMSSTAFPFPAVSLPPPLPLSGGSCGPALKASICEALKKKKEVLKKLIEDYQRLSELEREAINISFQFLVAQLEDTEQLLEFLNGCGECYHPPDCPPTESNLQTSTPPCAPNQEVTPNIPSQAPNPPSNQNNPNPSQFSSKNFSHVYHFEPIDECHVPNTTCEPQTTTVNPCCGNDNVEGGFEKVANSNEPQSFDLLPNHANNTANIPGPSNGAVHSRNIDKAGGGGPPALKESFPRAQQAPVNVQNVPLAANQIATLNMQQAQQNELHKLGIGDAAGLQLAHNFRSPWVSNLDAAKQKNNIAPNHKDALKPGNNDLSKAIKNYHLSKNSGSDSAAVKDVKTAKTRQSEDRPGVSGSGDKKTYSGLESPKLQFSVDRFPDDDEEDENSSTVRKIRKKRRTMRYNVRKKRKRNIMDKKFIKLISNKKKDNSEYEEDPEMEYLIWASMPAVRRRLNDLEQGIEVDQNSAQMLLGNVGSDGAEKEDKEKMNRFKLLGLRK